MFSKLHVKLTFVFVILFLFVQAIMAGFVYTATEKNVKDDTVNQLGRAARVLERVLFDRVEQLVTNSRNFAQNFDFREAFTNSDNVSLRRTMAADADRFGLSFVALVRGARDILQVGSERADVTKLVDTLLMEGMPPRGSKAFRSLLDGRIYDVVAQSVELDGQTSWLLTGVRFGEQEAFDIKALSALDMEIGLVAREDTTSPWQVRGATHSAVFMRQFVEDPVSFENFPTSISLGDEEFTVWRSDIERAVGGGEIAILLYYSFDEAFKAYESLFVTLGVVGISGLVVLLLCSVILAQGVSRPIVELAAAAEHIAAGNYEYALDESDSGQPGEIPALTRGFAHMIAAVKEREQRITYQAHHDPETGLSNRLCFERHLSEAVTSSIPFHVVVVNVFNLSGLRGIFDQDHIAELFSSIATRLTELSGLEVSQLSSGFFALHVPGEEHIYDWAAMALRAFEKPVNVRNIAVDVRMRLGVATYPSDGETASVLIRRAIAAFEQDVCATARIYEYGRDKDTAKLDRLSIMSDLRKGIENGEVSFAFQPKLDLGKDKVTAVEALVRWNSPVRGFVPPDEFIPIAEQTGEIRYLTEWGLDQVAAQVAAWRRAGLDLSAGMNLSSSDVLNPGLPDYVRRVLKKHDLDGSSLYLEVTESDVMADIDQAMDVMRSLHRVGVELAIDDYGTGHSSLRYLKRLPVTELKIDKEFVLRLAHSEEDKILVRSTIELGHNLGLKVTAEGVEDQTSMDLLRSYGCDYLQGFYIARPLPAKEIPNAVRRARLLEA